MLNSLGAPRLATVKTFFATQSEADLLGCYAWNQALASALLPLLSDFEVSVRNALHKALSQYYGAVDSYNWMLPYANPIFLTNPKAPPELPSRHKMTKRTREDLIAVRGKIKSKKSPGYIVTADDIVGAVNFGLWEVLVAGLSHTSQPTGLQNSILSSVFPYVPGMPSGSHGTPAFQKRIVDLLKRVRELRNRIGHHDSLWNQPEFNSNGTIGFIPRRPRHTVDSFVMCSQRILEITGWIHPEIPLHIKKSDHWRTFEVLLSRKALAAFRARGGEAGVYQELLGSTAQPKARHEIGLDHRVSRKISARLRQLSFHY